jgi:hypothetical protein
MEKKQRLWLWLPTARVRDIRIAAARENLRPAEYISKLVEDHLTTRAGDDDE